jgi:hypothetical protein
MIRVIPTVTFNAALGGIENVRFMAGIEFARPVMRAQVAPWLADGRLKEVGATPKAPQAPAQASTAPETVSKPAKAILEGMSKEQLVAQAEAEGVEIDARQSKSNLAKAILEARGA